MAELVATCCAGRHSSAAGDALQADAASIGPAVGADGVCQGGLPSAALDVVRQGCGGGGARHLGGGRVVVPGLRYKQTSEHRGGGRLQKLLRGRATC